MSRRLRAWWGALRGAALGLRDRLAPTLPVRILVALVRTFRSRGCVPRAAEIAFYTVLSVVPFTVLALTALGYASVELMDIGWSLGDVGVALGAALPEMLPYTGEASAMAVGLLVEDREALGWLGGAATLLVASLSFGAVSRAVAHVFEQQRRSLPTTFLMFLAMSLALLTLCAIVLGGVVASSIGPRLSSLAESALALHLVGLGAMGVGFVLVLRLVLRVKPAWTWTALGGAVFVGLFELARVVYALYLGTVSQLHVVYGSLAGTMAAILWAYYVAFIFLLCASAVRVMEARLHAGELGRLAPRVTRVPARAAG